PPEHPLASPDDRFRVVADGCSVRQRICVRQTHRLDRTGWPARTYRRQGRLTRPWLHTDIANSHALSANLSFGGAEVGDLQLRRRRQNIIPSGWIGVGILGRHSL